METKHTAVVTGATSGLGAAGALALAQKGWRVLIVGRDETRGAEVVERARSQGGDVEFVTGDLFTVGGVRKVAAELSRLAPRVDLLVNNAGGTFGKKQVTVDGLERTFALNVMAPYALTEALMPSLSSAKGRVVNLVTGIPKGAKATMAELTGEKSSAGVGSYTRSKLALAALTQELQRRHSSHGVTVVSLHPGIIPGTRFGQDMPAFLRAIAGFVARLFGLASTADEAAERYVLVGTGSVQGGGFYNQGKLADPPRFASDRAFARELWEKLEALCRTASGTRSAAAAIGGEEVGQVGIAP